jgi:cyclin B
LDNPIKNIILQQQKALQTKKYINKRNISGLRKIPTTTTNTFGQNNVNINKTLDNHSKLCIQLKDRNKKIISLKILKKQILMGPHSTNENKSQNYMNQINKKHGMNTMLNNYLNHRTTYSEMNSVFIYNNSTSNCNTTCNTHTNSNNKNKSMNNSIFKKISSNVQKLKINNSKIKALIANKNNKEEKTLIVQKNEKCNIDIKRNENSVKNVEEYIDDILENLLKEEKNSEIKISNSYFKFQTDINNKMRAILIDWLIEVHLKFGFKPETLYITIYIIDSYLSLKKIERCNFQLLGVAALLIACKQNEIIFHKLKEYVYITDNAYTENDIKKMEYKILGTLNFNILNPSSLSFFEILSNKMGLSQDKKKFHLGEFLMESFYLDENCLKYSASTIACTVQYIVMKYFKMNNYKECYNKTLFNIKKIEEFENKYAKSNNYAIHIIKECAKDICYCINELPRGNLKSTLRKYSNDNFDNVAKLLYGNLEYLN